MAKIIGEALPNLPWQERPASNSDAVWRYSANPVITTRFRVPTAFSIQRRFRFRESLPECSAATILPAGC